MFIITSFQRLHNIKEGFFAITSEECHCCPLCHGKLIYRDRKPRTVLDYRRNVTRYLLRRFCCANCKKLHTEIPDIIQPYKHYNGAAIQSVIDGDKNAVFCLADDSTMNHWKASFASTAEEIEATLISVYAKQTERVAPIAPLKSILAFIRTSQKRWLAVVTKLLINGGYRRCTQFACCPSRCSAIVAHVRKNNANGGKKSDKTINDTG